MTITRPSPKALARMTRVVLASSVFKPAAYRLRCWLFVMCLSNNGSRGRSVIQLYSHTFWQERTTVAWNSCNVGVTKILYGSPAWSGLCSAADRSRLNAFLRRCKRYNYCSNDFPAIEELFFDAYDTLFERFVY